MAADKEKKCMGDYGRICCNCYFYRAKPEKKLLMTLGGGVLEHTNVSSVCLNPKCLIDPEHFVLGYVSATEARKDMSSCGKIGKHFESISREIIEELASKDSKVK